MEVIEQELYGGAITMNLPRKFGTIRYKSATQHARKRREDKPYIDVIHCSLSILVVRLLIKNIGKPPSFPYKFVPLAMSVRYQIIRRSL